MNVNSLLDLLQRKNIRIHVDRDELVVRAPRGALNAELTQALKKSKAELIDVLRRRGAQASPDPVRITPAQLTLVALSQESIDALMTKVEGGAANVQDIYPLAPLQEGILFHHLMSGESDPYVLSGVLAFRGREVMERFVSALQQVIDRHDILRTGFFWEGLEQPVQVVQRRATLPVSVVELDAREGDIVRQLEARFDSRGYRMDVSRAPLMHVHAACDGEHERWVARVLFHHLSIDHTTLERVIEEARAIGQGRVEDLPQPEPFRNFVAQARLGVSEADHEAYFRAKLGDIDEPTAPFGLLSVQGDGREIAEAARTLKPELSGALRGHARRLGVSAASMMHVAWGLVLSRTTGRQDVVFGTVLFGRMQGGAQSDRSLGLFINTLPVRMRVAQTGVEASVKGTHAQLAELMRHEHAPLVLAQRCSGVPAQTPLFTSLLNYRYSKPKVAAAHIADGIELLDGHERTSYPLSVTVDDHERDFTIVAKVCERIGPQRVCELMELALEQLTRALSANPGGELAELDVLPAAERTQVLHGWNETGRAYARDACLHQLFEAQVSRTPEAAAVICGDETLSYTDLDARANRLAHYLRGQGVGPDTRVGLALGRGVEMMTGLLAILKAGGAYVPLDPGYASERLRAILDDSRPAIVLADAAGRAALDALAGAPPIADLHADASRWSALPSTPPRVEGLTPRHLAYVIYTSGSTGQPKGVMVEHASVVNLWRALDEAIYRTHPSARRVSLNASIAFDSLVKQWVQLLSGRTLVVVPEPVRFDGRRLLDAIGRDRIDVFDCTPSQLALIEGARGPEDEAYPQVTLVGGEAIGEGMWSELASVSSRTYYNVYGPTECTVDATLARITAEHAPHIGGPLANVRAYVLNERLSPAPVGVRGELYIGGAGVARGYLNRPELTRERFIDDPFVAGGRLYKTGDLARWRTDGSLEYLGRNDFQVKIRGFRIELGEIEAQLAKVTGVREVVVLARDSASAVHDSATEHAAPDALSPSPETSTATAAATATATATATEKRLVAYYTGDADVAALRAQAAQHLPSYMVPSAYVRLDAWPLTPNGKLDRRALPAPADDAYARAEYEAPQGAKEEALAEIWRDLLQVDRISRHDNFFELGGHSLLAAYVPLDPGYASERLRAILDDSRPAIVLADAAGRAALDALAGAPPIADLHADASRWSALPSTPPRVEGLTPRHLAYVIYTSGSTGQPKGVMVEHASVVNLWRALDEAIYRTHPSARRVSLNASIAFDSLVKQWVQLLSGRTLVVVPEPVRFDGRRLLDAIGRDRIDVFDCTPSQLALIEGARGPEDEAYPQVTLVGGEAIGEGMWSELASASSRTYYNVYGPTECTVDATLARITAEHAPHIGGPLANVRAYVLNERLSPAPVGVRGELYIGGAGVARGYLNRPELTRERFIDDPFVAGGRLYRTGDLARWRTDGKLEYLGRNDFQVKIRGFRIELGEIEAQLAKVAGVREVVVLARDSASEVHDSATEHATPDALSPSPETSTATATATATEKRLVAYYTGDADVVALRAQAAQHLPSYMVPSAYVRLDAWPLTPNGKLDRRALPAPADDAYARAEYEAPQGAKEEALAAIWRELLHVERVSRHDNFFELGGHSLLAVQLVSRLRQALSVEVALSTVFDAPVLSALAERLEAGNTEVLPPIPLAPRDGRIALSLAQQRLWFLTQLEGVSEAYHMSGAVRLDGPLNREVLQRALNRIVMRHEALRTCFVREEGEPIQVIQPHADLTVSYHDLREAESIRHEAGNREQRAKDLSQAHASAPFDLSRDLPVRVLLLQL
ncbi:non-ribosomal peptide synthetase, partial [Burkholderia pseudomallei]|uniref:non-ribosomal peptide synthetase n=4 Tax=Burkholderia pseudomallei TaxID=28450 RepID=UPI0018A6BD83